MGKPREDQKRNSVIDAKRPRAFLLLVSAMVAIAPFAIDTYLPALPHMAAAFNVDIVQVNFTVSSYLIGFGIGQLIGGPLSDQIGRRPVGLIGLAVFVVGAIAIAFATTIEQVQALRTLQALGGGWLASICMAMVRDSYSPTIAAQKIPIVMLVMMVAPLVAPIVGTLLLPLGWQSNFYFLAAYGALIFVLFSQLGETNATRTGKVALARLVPQYIEVLSRRVGGRLIPLRYILIQGFVSSALMVFLTNAAFIYLEYFDVGTVMFPVFFGANVVTMMFFTYITATLVRRIEPFRIFRAGTILQLTFVICLGLMTFLSEPSVIVFSINLALVIGSSGLINSTINGLHLANFQRLAGSAAALMSLSVFSFGAALGAASGLFYDGTLIPIVTVMLGAIVISNLLAWTTPPPENWSDEAIAASQSNSRFD